MPDTIPTIKTLNNLLDYDAGRFTAAEVLLRNFLQDAEVKARSLAFKTVIIKYRDTVNQNIENLDLVISAEDIHAMGATSPVMKSLISETEEKLGYCTEPTVQDAILLAGIQAINHHKICVYGTAAAYANMLEMSGHARLFHDAEIKEKQIDDRLTQLAAFEINRNANSPVAISNEV